MVFLAIERRKKEEILNEEGEEGLWPQELK